MSKQVNSEQDNIRNFCIIAHIDHGKSTLADRLLELTGAISTSNVKTQILDDMDLEIEKGITIKSHAIQLEYNYNGCNYILNLIDTPGHVDFSYEVSRSVTACEGALLLVDATQGIQAQTISNLYMAIDHNLTIIPIINKIDLPGARIDLVKQEIIDLIGCDESEIILASAKTGEGINDVLEVIINKIPSPKGDRTKPLQAMIFDSVFNSYKGIEVYFRIFNGEIRSTDVVRFINTGKEYNINELGILKLKQESCDYLSAGNVGYLISGVKKATEIKVGDTITNVKNPCKDPIKGFADVKPMVFAGIYPVDSTEYDLLREAIEKLQLNDASLIWTNESSIALGYGFRCGFLGMLHLEVVQERLFREFGISVISTVPSVEFHVYDSAGGMIIVDSPSKMPDPSCISRIEEPIVNVKIITKTAFIGDIITLCTNKRGTLLNQNFISQERIELTFNIPLVEMVFDFFDKLKSISKGYASLDYEMSGYQVSDMVKLDILLNHSKVDAFSTIIHRSKADYFGRELCGKLKEFIPRQMFEVPIQAAIGGKVIARETIKAFRKDVTSKCYGGDISRKRKLLEKQKEGKKKMKQIGNVEIPQEAFISILKI